MEPEEDMECFEDTILSRTPESGQKGCYAKVSLRQPNVFDIYLLSDLTLRLIHFVNHC